MFRIARPDDTAGILAIYAPFCESSPVSFEIVAPSESQMRNRIDGILAQFPWLVCENNGEIAGYVYASQHRERAAYRWSVDVAVYVAAAHRRKGLARALYGSLFSILRQQGYFKAFASITLPNPASVGLHETVGFRRVGVFLGAGYKLGSWLDVGWWQLDLQSEKREPVNPQPFPEVRDRTEISAALAEGARSLGYN